MSPSEQIAADGADDAKNSSDHGPQSSPSSVGGIDLGDFLRERFGGGKKEMGEVQISDARILGGGASKEMWSFRVERASDRNDTSSTPQPAENSERLGRFVLRRSPPKPSDRSLPSGQLFAGSLDSEAEYAVVRAAHAGGVRLPEPLFAGRDGEGNPFCILEHIEGETLAPRLFRKQEFENTRRVLTAQMGAAAAAIHSVEVSPELIDALGPLASDNPAAASLEQYESIYRAVTPEDHPVFEIALRHLRATLPKRWSTGLVHGDFRLGNIMFGAEGLRSILDWELAHWGDPAEDLAWAAVRAWRFGRDKLAVAGLGTRAEFHRAYQEAGGEAIDEGRARWWEIFGNLRWGVITLIQASIFLDGSTRDLEKAAIGRRTAEVEAELLNLIRD